ncbi:MAG: NAD(P)H-hydrate dehydratase [Proteobacteria bacterium]|nr:NAD(P)H-hydrate dehydratase [Pseudomonadota bacterium]
MIPVVTAAEMRALDRATIDEIGLPAMTLMETAGRAVAAAAIRMLAPSGPHPVAVVCGPGNCGGDGFVAARVLRASGHDAVAYLAVARDQIRGDALAHLLVLERSGGVVRELVSPSDLTDLKPAIAGAALVVDALFGTGLARPITGHLAEVVGAMNLAALRLAVDVPSGLDADTGAQLGACVRADRTVTLGLRKVGLTSAPGFAVCGVVEVADIGIPPSLVAASTITCHLVEERDVLRALRRPTPLDHKGSRGHVLVIGGSPGMRGAGRLAALAALRAGAGLVTLAGPEADSHAPDPVMTRTLAGPLDLARMTAIVIGPGLADLGSWVAEVLAGGVPAVLDAGALTVSMDTIAAAAGPVVITPHPGEAGRMLGITAAEVERDRLAVARALAARTRAIVVLKGARTIVCDGTLADDHCAINPTGGPALATGGSGDVLAGVIGALLAQGIAAGLAAQIGVYVHGLAGERLARGAIASDLPEAVARAIASLE